MKHANHNDQLTRLKRAEGQVKAIIRMVETDRYCVDILTQLRAARSALRKVEENILREHVEHCVVHAIKSGKRSEQDSKIDELLDVFSRYGS